MSNRGATPQEREDCVKLYRAVGELLEKYDVDVILNTLCFIVAEQGVHINMTKREFIAQVVDQISSAYHTCDALNGKGEDDA